MKRLTPLWSLLPLVLAAPAWAAEESGSFFETYRTAIEVGVSIINFAVFAYLIVRFGGPAIKHSFANKAREYQEKVREANVLLAEAQRLHAEWSARRQGLEDEARRIQDDARRLAEAQAVEILENARVQSARMVADAERTVTSELMLAKDELRRELVNALVDKAEEKLTARLAPSHQRALIDEAMHKLETSE